MLCLQKICCLTLFCILWMKEAIYKQLFMICEHIKYTFSFLELSLFKFCSVSFESLFQGCFSTFMKMIKNYLTIENSLKRNAKTFF